MHPLASAKNVQAHVHVWIIRPFSWLAASMSCTIQMHNNVCMCRQSHKHSLFCTHIRAHTHTHSLFTRTGTHTDTAIHRHRHSHTHSHTHNVSHTQERVVKLVCDGVNVFFTGNAGTGKTFLLNGIINELRLKYGSEFTSKVAVCATTGIAATHISGGGGAAALCLCVWCVCV